MSETVPACHYTGYQLDMTAQFQSAKHVSQTECEWAMKWIVDICHWEHQDSRGGWWQFTDDGTTSMIDPQKMGFNRP